MKPNRTILALFVALLALPLVAVGQGEEASNGVASNDETVENSAVVSRKSKSSLRREVFEAEEDFYSIFNNLNDDKDFDVRCRYEKATGTNIKNHVCRARFVSKAFERHARRNRNDMSRAANQSADPIFEAKTLEYQKRMEELMAANPELQAAFDRYNTARVQFTAHREENVRN